MKLINSIPIVPFVSKSAFKEIKHRDGSTSMSIESHRAKSVRFDLFKFKPNIMSGTVETYYDIIVVRIRFIYDDVLDHKTPKQTAINGLVGVDRYNRLSYIDVPIFADVKTTKTFYDGVKVRLRNIGVRPKYNHIMLDGEVNKKNSNFLYASSCNAVSDVLHAHDLWEVLEALHDS